ncbi:MAG: hypothetical protein QM762_13255 [Chryseolinea sp.]
MMRYLLAAIPLFISMSWQAQEKIIAFRYLGKSKAVLSKENPSGIYKSECADVRPMWAAGATGPCRSVEIDFTCMNVYTGQTIISLLDAPDGVLKEKDKSNFVYITSTTTYYIRTTGRHGFNTLTISM